MILFSILLPVVLFYGVGGAVWWAKCRQAGVSHRMAAPAPLAIEAPKAAG